MMDIKPLLRQLNLRPSKGRGQSFLVDESVLDAILDAAEVSPEDTILEVGPGLGILTAALAQRAGRVVAVEIEPRLAAHLRKSLAIFSHVQIVEGDILTLPGTLPEVSEPPGGFPYKVVANIPYAITSALLRHFLESPSPPTRLVLMVQKEVAQRIVAAPGHLSLLALSVQFYGDPRLVAMVPARAFYPVPQVDSAILRVDVLPQPRLAVEPQRFFRVAAAGFSQKRKQLKNSLAGGLGLSSQETVAILQAVGIDAHRRAETLNLEEWGRLTQALGPQRTSSLR